MNDHDELAAGILAGIRLYATASMASDGMAPTLAIRDMRAGLTSTGEDAMIRFLVGVVQVTLSAIEGPTGADRVMAGVLDSFSDGLLSGD